MMSNKERKKRQHEKEINSLRNKMGSNIVWFDSLSKTKQYDFLFAWKRHLYQNHREKPEYQLVTKRVPIDEKRPWGRKKITKVVELKYPASLKHFIRECMLIPSFKPMAQKLREKTIEILLKQKSK